MTASGDMLYLLQPGFADPERPGRFFVCPHCNGLEGLLASFPGLATQIDIVRVPFERPREAVVQVLGEAHQVLPVLVFADGKPVPQDADVANGRRFIASTDRIFEVLAERYGFPALHR